MPTTIEVQGYKVEELRTLEVPAFNRAYNDWYQAKCAWGYDRDKEVREIREIIEHRFGVTLEFNTDYPAYSRAKFVPHRWQNYNFVLGYGESIDPESLEGIKLYSWLLYHFEWFLFKGKYYSKGKYVDGKYTYIHRHSKVLLEPSCPDGTFLGCAAMDPFWEFFKHVREPSWRHYNLQDLMNDVAESIAECIQQDWESSTSEEAFIEDCENFSVLFDKHGRMIREDT